MKIAIKYNVHCCFGLELRIVSPNNLLLHLKVFQIQPVSPNICICFLHLPEISTYGRVALLSNLIQRRQRFGNSWGSLFTFEKLTLFQNSILCILNPLLLTSSIVTFLLLLSFYILTRKEAFSKKWCFIFTFSPSHVHGKDSKSEFIERLLIH